MSQFEMKNKSVIKIMIAGCLGVLPHTSFASVRCFQIAPFSTSINLIRGPASINRAATSLVAPSRVFYGENGKELSPDLIANFKMVKSKEKSVDMTEMIPMNMKPSDNSSEVFSQVADKTLTTILNSEAVRGSTLGQAATEVENNMKAQVVLGGSSPEETQHKLNFNMQAFQATAQVQYTGFTNASLKYKVAEKKLGLEVSEHVQNNQDLVVSHTLSNSDRLSEVSFRWNF